MLDHLHEQYLPSPNGEFPEHAVNVDVEESVFDEVLGSPNDQATTSTSPDSERPADSKVKLVSSKSERIRPVFNFVRFELG